MNGAAGRASDRVQRGKPILCGLGDGFGPPRKRNLTQRNCDMTLKTTALALILGAAALGAATAAAAQPLAPPARHAIAAHRTQIRTEARRGEISHAQAHRMRVVDRHVARRARLHGGHLTRVQAHRLHRQEVRLQRHS
jgi:hypothetical protein